MVVLICLQFLLIIDIQIYVTFKCRMCGEQLSSSWEAEKKKHNMWSVENQPFMQTVKQKMVKFQRTVVEPEFKKAISDGIVEEIYWVGGEPLCMIYIGGH